MIVYMDNFDNNFDIEKNIKHWLKSSDDDFEAMKVMFSNKHYDWAMFIGHLVVEKLLKAYYIKEKKTFPPLIHNLLRIAEMADLQLDDEHKKCLIKITTFNINARYDDYKREFYKMCTPDFAKEWLSKIEDLRKWLKEKF
jgi:HEPN domain-containing protein